MSKSRNDLLYSVVPLSTDVLLGRGKSVHQHDGNIVYRKLVKERSHDYQSKVGIDKDAVAEAVIREIEDRGGRFLRQVGNGLHWEECPCSMSRTKVKQALRDFLKPKRCRDAHNIPRKCFGKASAARDVTQEEDTKVAASPMGAEIGMETAGGGRHEELEAIAPEDNMNSVSQLNCSGQARETVLPQRPAEVSQLSALAAQRLYNQFLPSPQPILNLDHLQEQYLQLLVRQQTAPSFFPSLASPTSITMNQPTPDTAWWLRNYHLLGQQQHSNAGQLRDAEFVELLRRMNQR